MELGCGSAAGDTAVGPATVSGRDRYDPGHIAWQMVEAIRAQVFVLATDEVLGTADVLIKFQAVTPGKLHRHVCDFSTFVLQGEGISSPFTDTDPCKLAANPKLPSIQMAGGWKNYGR
jgi:hypothetical protein